MWFAEIWTGSTFLHSNKVRPGVYIGFSTTVLSFPLMNLPALHPPPTAVSPASLPPVSHYSGFPSSHSDVLPACLLSLHTTLPDTQTDAHMRVHTHTHFAVMPLVIKGRPGCAAKTIWTHGKNYYLRINCILTHEWVLPEFLIFKCVVG